MRDETRYVTRCCVTSRHVKLESDASSNTALRRSFTTVTMYGQQLPIDSSSSHTYTDHPKLSFRIPKLPCPGLG